ncbi:hypothetical protein NQ314_013469 [Rhamnusium bicolor]|uniref:DUF5641 domain-containing protein n=1 Tax=Rhamnusium bicolor TaxID=1586634 RepID=A0AAV8X6W8_9CUCU|nr:hypothetical protein NQ314_013469 [Rhamnusium bicolor]
MASEEVLKQRKNAKATISRIGNFLEAKKDQKLDILQYKTREEALEKAFEKFCEAQDEIDNISSSPKEAAERISLEERYYDILTNLKRLAQSRAEQNGSNVQNINPSTVATKMPEIVIEKFTGEPLKLVETLSLTSANLQVAIKILTERYENKLATIYSHIKGLVELPSITKSNPTNPREFVVSIKQNTESLKNLQVPVESWNLILVYILSQKLDFHTRKAYELERGPAQLPTLENFLKFVEKRCLATENLSSPEIKRKAAHFATSNSDIRSDNNATKIQNACTYCKAYDHDIYRCSKFKDLTVFQRKQFVFNKRLCFKCFLKHPVDQCRWKNCPICGQSHHSLLHSQGHSKPMFNNNQNGNNFHSQNKVYLNQPQGQGSAGSAGPSQSCVNHSQHVLIATAMVLIPDSNGKIITAKAILDNGSQTSLVTSDLVKKLNFCSYTKNVQVSGVSGKKSMCNQMVVFDIISQYKVEKMQLHGYADASLKAYGACLYLRVLYENVTVSSRLICSKSRVSPLRTVSLPRLELCACLLLAKLTHKILGIFKNSLTVESVNLWTDSQICLCWINSHPRDSLSAYPEKELLDVPDNRLSIWQKCVKIQQTFWKSWSVEYLNRLQNKPKWLSPSKNLIVNQVVLLKEDNTLPLRWPLARIVETIPGAGGKVRVVKLRTKDGIFTRPIAKICPLHDERTLEEVRKIVEHIDSD